MIACLDIPDESPHSIITIADQLGLPLIKPSRNDEYPFYLCFREGRLGIQPADKKQGGHLSIDFNDASLVYRMKTSGIKQELARACGCKPEMKPVILDATAGLGKDSFILASLGCHITMVEENPVIHAMLSDAFYRATLLDNEIGDIVLQNMQLLSCQDSCDLLKSQKSGEPGNPAWDVIYIDPMFPERNKSAKVKKGMQFFHELLDISETRHQELFSLSLGAAGKRVVVKRPKGAGVLSINSATNEKAISPSHSINGKTIRYDVYLQ